MPSTADRSALTLTLLPGEFAIHRLPPRAPIPRALLGRAWVSTVRTPDELTLICPHDADVRAETSSWSWRCLAVIGPLPLDLTGVIAGISRVLADADVPVFVLSAYGTDYVYVRDAGLDRAVAALEHAGMTVTGRGRPRS